MVVCMADYLINFLSYYIVYRCIICVPFRKKVLLNLGAAIVLAPLVVGLCKAFDFGYDRFIMSLAALLALFALVEGERVRVLMIFPIAFFATGSFSILVTYLFSFATGIRYIVLIRSKWWGIAAEAVFPLLFFVFFFIFKRLREERETVVLSVPQYMIALLGSVCLFFVISVSQGIMEEKTELADWIRPLSVCLVIVGIIFVALILWQSQIEKKALQYKMENEYYQLCLKRQETHIREIVENDQKIRRFRHDVNAHLTALEQCLQTNDLQQLKSYVERMRAETRKLEVRKFTGIGVVDAIVSEWYQKAENAGITWEWDGMLGPTEMEVFDLCVVFSNLLSNAVEAAEQVEEGRERKISISCGTFRERICIRVSNTCRINPGNRTRHGTTKSDHKNHGFGLVNIRNTVTNANGEFEIREEPGIFTAEIIV